MNTPAAESVTAPGLGDACRVWLQIGLLSFGGPAAQVALMHRLVVDERRWVSDPAFVRALNFCMLLPGPEAMQLATYLGWMLHGRIGGLMAGVLFIAPGALLMLVVSVAYVRFADTSILNAIFFGVQCAVVVVVAQALIRVARRVTPDRIHLLLAFTAFVALYLVGVPFPLVIGVAALAGAVLPGLTPPGDAMPRTGKATAGNTQTLAGALLTLLIGLAIWFAPVVTAAVVLSPDHALVNVGLFFSRLAVVTFGGAYTVLAYMTQEAVDAQGWLTASEMIDGLGLAESTPGPLILVTQFVAFLAGYREAAPFGTWVGAGLATAMALWTTFVPCFLWIALGAPWVERLGRARRLAGALAGIGAAVVGIIASLAAGFAMNVLFTEISTVTRFGLDVPVPALDSVQPWAVAFVLGAGVLALGFRRSAIVTLSICACAALVLPLPV